MIIDILVLLVLALSALIAFLRGFIREVLTIIGVLGGMVAAYYAGPHLLPIMEGWLGVDPNAEDPQKLFDIIPYTYVAAFLAYGSIFVIVVVILSIISHMIAEAVKSVGLGAIDRTLGVVFGLARGILLLGILYLPVHLTIEQETRDGWFEGARSHVYIEMTAEVISGYLPEEAKQGIEDQVEEGSAAIEGKTRENLERMDLLKRNERPAQAPAQDKGYNERQREEMDKLFEDFDENDATNTDNNNTERQ
jgi:membrane protein required for colicin V production